MKLFSYLMSKLLRVSLFDWCDSLSPRSFFQPSVAKQQYICWWRQAGIVTSDVFDNNRKLWPDMIERPSDNLPKTALPHGKTAGAVLESWLSWSCCSSLAISAFIWWMASLQTLSFSFNSLISLPIFCRAPPMDAVVLCSISAPLYRRMQKKKKRLIRMNDVSWATLSLSECLLILLTIEAIMNSVKFGDHHKKWISRLP